MQIKNEKGRESPLKAVEIRVPTTQIKLEGNKELSLMNKMENGEHENKGVPKKPHMSFKLR